MTARWERFSGDEAHFAIRVALRPDPDPTFVDDDVACTWGSIQIWAQGKNLCAHADQGETLDSIHWYLLSFVEWIAANWDPLFHEERLPIAIEGATAIESLAETVSPSSALPDEVAEQRAIEWFEWWRRHAVRAARDGGPFPDLVFRRWRDEIELSWGDTPIAGAAGLDFLSSSGAARLPPNVVAEPLADVLLALTDELASRRPDSTRLIELQTVVAELFDTAAERTRARVAWMAGLRSAGSVLETWSKVESALGTGNAAARRAATIVRERAGVVDGSCQAALLFGAVAPDVTESDVQILAELLLDQYASGSHPTELDAVSTPRPVPKAGKPWQDGFDLALDFREAMGLVDSDATDVDHLLDRLGIAVLARTLSDESIRGIALSSSDHVPTVVTNTASPYSSPEARRFTLAHELCHFLVDRGLAGQRLAVASGPWAPLEVEQRANAFAAYLLMPPRGLWARALEAEHPTRSREGVAALARHYQVSYNAMVEHLPNVGLITAADRHRLLRRAVA